MPRPAQRPETLVLADISPDISIRDVIEDGDTLRVVFGPDGHPGVIPRTLLTRPPDDDGRTEDSKQLWDTLPFPPTR